MGVNGFESSFELEPTIARIEFDGRWSGLQIECSLDIDLDQFYAMAAQSERLLQSRQGSNPKDVIRESLAFLIDVTGPSWNLTKGGQPVPFAIDEVMKLPANLLLQIVPKYTAAVQGAFGVDVPLEQPSSDSVPPAELSMPTETL